MPDKLTPEQRHRNMAAIRSKDTRPEWIVRRCLHAHGYRYRLHVKSVPTTPDIVLRRLHTVILVNGCFWHGHHLQITIDENNKYEIIKNIAAVVNSKCCKIPHTNREFWVTKILRNKERDERDRKELTRLGWNVIQIWECELKPAKREATLQSLLLTLSKIELSIAGREKAVAQSNVVEYNYEEPSVKMVADDSEI